MRSGPSTLLLVGIATDTASMVDRPLRADAARNRRRILDAARELMASEGAGFEMSDIAEAASVGVGTLYRRFPDKGALIGELVREKFLDLLRVMESEIARRELTARERLDNYIRAACRIQARDRGLHEAMSGASSIHRNAAEQTEGLREALELLVREAREEGSVRDDLQWQDVVMCTCALGHLTQVEDDLPGTVARMLEIQLAGLDPAR